jgi:hypothetical protein
MKKAVFIVMVVVTILCALAEVTGLQLLPLALGTALVGFEVFAKKDLSVWIFALSIVYFFINMVEPSLIDMLLWLLVAVVFIPKK